MSGLRANMITSGVPLRETSSRGRSRFTRHVVDELEGLVKVGENIEPIVEVISEDQLSTRTPMGISMRSLDYQ